MRGHGKIGDDKVRIEIAELSAKMLE